MRCLIALALSIFTFSSLASAQEFADTVFRNGPIYTVDSGQPWASGLAVREGAIVFVGDSSGVDTYIGPGTRVVDLAGRLALPGLHDAHVHLLEANHRAQGTCYLPAGTPPESHIVPLRQCAPNQVGTEWVLGFGHSIWDLRDHLDAGGRSPIEILDEAIPHLPVAIMEETSHSVWANTVAIELAGLHLPANVPPGGVVVRDQFGEPNGVLLDAAGEVVLDLALTPNAVLEELNREALLAGLQLAREHGITSVGDARGHWRRGYVEAWQQVEAEGLLTARAVVSLWAYPYLDDVQQIASLAALYSNEPGRRLRFSQIKMYSDGEIWQTSAALLSAYRCCAWAGPTGLTYYSEQRLTNFIEQLAAVGFDFHIHAIGDRGVYQALNAVEAAQEACEEGSPCSNARHRLTHLELVHPLEVPRFAELGVIADLQMSHPAVEPAAAFDNAFLIGNSRINQRQWRLRDLWESGATVVLSSDYDVGSLNAFEGMQRAISRGDQSLPNLAAAVRAYTLNPAFLMHQKEAVGSLEVGKRADVTVADQNIFDVPVNRIGETSVILTMVDGEVVFERFAGDEIFSDGFESGDRSRWSEAGE